VEFTEAVWAQSLEAFGLVGRTQFLTRGLHRARSIRLFWTTPDEPTNLTYLDAFHDVFKRIRLRLRFQPGLPRRLLLARGRSGNLRITAAETALVEQVTARHGFVPLHLETLNFFGQAEALFNADCVVAVHGAGMANILFGRNKLRVLELNLRLDGETLLRPWFYLLAYAQRQKYMMLDRDTGDLSPERLDAAIETLLASH
jgi:capsular polysaccharide biosynthesis protein